VSVQRGFYVTSSRLARIFCSEAICSLRTLTLSISSTAVSSSFSSLYLLTPTMTLALVDQRFARGGGFFDHPFRQSGFDRFRHAARLVDLFDNRARLLNDPIGERLDVIRSTQRIDGAADL
jgi:hypothetical protein